MKKIHEITFQITDRKEKHRPETREIVGEDPKESLSQWLRKNSHAMGLTKNHTFEVLACSHVGFGY